MNQLNLNPGTRWGSLLLEPHMDAYDKANEAGRAAAKPLWAEVNRLKDEALDGQRVALRDKISGLHTLIKQIKRAAEVNALKAHRAALRRRNPHLANLWR